MTDLLNAFEALAMVPGWDPACADIEALPGGLTNRSFHVRQGDRQCVLRLDSLQTGAFELDRHAEIPILVAANKAGLAPKVLFAHADAGILVTEFLPGRAWQADDLQRAENLEALALLIRKVHALPESGSTLDLQALAVRYESYLEQRHGLHAFASRCVAVIEAVPTSGETVCCHNDIVAANVIEDADLRLIDWEYACDNDPLFDLASVIGFHDLDERRAAILLRAYAGGEDGELSERLAEQMRAYDAIQWLWLAMRQLVYPSHRQAERLEELQQRIG